MNIAEICIVVAVVVFMLAVGFGKLLQKKKQKKSGCSGGCGSCPYSSSCSSNAPSQKKK